MTALDEYARLESGGLWRPSPEEQRKNVVLSFGNATLVIADTAGRPLTHWSLPAVQRLNPTIRPALYSPDPDATETLEIEDDLMIDALERIQAAVRKSRGPAVRLRLLTWGIGLAGLAAAAWVWLPPAMMAQTASVVPEGKRSEIGARLLGHLQGITGQTCRNPLGVSALGTLQSKVAIGDEPFQVVVAQGEMAAPAVLPGRIIVLPARVIADADTPEVVAGHIIAAAASSEDFPPLERLLNIAGLRETFRLLTTGDVPEVVLQQHAQHIVDHAAPLSDTPTLAAAFEGAQVPLTPWAFSLDPTGATVSDLFDADWATGIGADSLLTDGSWVSLQGICQS